MMLSYQGTCLQSPMVGGRDVSWNWDSNLGCHFLAVWSLCLRLLTCEVGIIELSVRSHQHRS